MADKNDDVLQDLLDPKKLLEQLRECETKQFKNAIDLLQECEERHRRNEKKLSRLTIASSAGAAIIGKEAAEEDEESDEAAAPLVSPKTECRSDVAKNVKDFQAPKADQAKLKALKAYWTVHCHESIPNHKRRYAEA